ncbi:MAG: hypothetical protein ACE5J6_02615, partial [Candidatus Bathyarchaeia archaeon]
IGFFKDVFGYGELSNYFAIVGYEKDGIIPCSLTAFNQKAFACGFSVFPSFNEAVEEIVWIYSMLY